MNKRTTSMHLRLVQCQSIGFGFSYSLGSGLRVEFELVVFKRSWEGRNYTSHLRVKSSSQGEIGSVARFCWDRPVIGVSQGQCLDSECSARKCQHRVQHKMTSYMSLPSTRNYGATLLAQLLAALFQLFTSGSFSPAQSAIRTTVPSGTR